MKLRCPYCKHEYGPEPISTCPYCKRAMKIPDNLRKIRFRQRKRKRETIAREAERQRAELGIMPDASFGRRPAHVLFILAFLMVLGILLVAKVNTQKLTHPQAAIQRTGRHLRALSAALERFRRDCGRYPTTKEGLEALVLNPGEDNWGGRSGKHYVNIVIPDPWKNRYYYVSTNNTFLLLSAGPDGKLNTEDDIVPEIPTEEEIAGPHQYWNTNRIASATSSTPAPPADASSTPDPVAP